jgi:hypothetical protein
MRANKRDYPGIQVDNPVVRIREELYQVLPYVS